MPWKKFASETAATRSVEIVAAPPPTPSQSCTCTCTCMCTCTCTCACKCNCNCKCTCQSNHTCTCTWTCTSTCIIPVPVLVPMPVPPHSPAPVILHVPVPVNIPAPVNYTCNWTCACIAIRCNDSLIVHCTFLPINQFMQCFFFINCSSLSAWSSQFYALLVRELGY